MADKEQIAMPYLNFTFQNMQNIKYSEHLTPQKHRSMEQLLKSPGIQDLVKDSIKSVLNNPNHITQYRYENQERSESPMPSSQLPKLERYNNTNVLKQIHHLKQKKNANSPKSYKKSYNLHQKFKQGRFLQMFPQVDGQNTLNIQSKPIHVIKRIKLQEAFLNNSMDARAERDIIEKLKQKMEMDKQNRLNDIETVKALKLLEPRKNSQLLKTSRNSKFENISNMSGMSQSQQIPQVTGPIILQPIQQQQQVTKQKKKKQKKFDGIYFIDPKYPQDVVFQEKYASMRHYFNILNLSNCIFVQPTVNIYKAYVGKGNNGMLVRQILKSRWWWSIQDEMEQCHFVWTQLKVNSIHENMKSLIRNPNEQNTCQSASSSITTIGSIGLYKQDDQSDNEQQIKNNKIVNSQWSKFLSYNEIRQYSQILNGQGRFSKLLTLEQAQNIKMKLTIYNEPIKVHNHLENNFHLGNKKALFYNMKAYYESQNINVFDNLPVTYHIKSLDGLEYKQFLDAYKERQQLINSEQDKRRNIWIIKPGEITNRGNGIKISEDLNEIQSILNSREMHKNGSYKTFIVQLYIDRPLLYNKRKFDIRCYSLYVSINGNQKGYWYTEGYVRTSSKEFSMKNLTNKMIHLTNDAVQKKGEDYGKYEKGNKVSFEEFAVYIENLGGDFTKIYQKMKQMATDQFRAVYGKMDQNKKENTFEIFGLDFMIDDSFKVLMIEANTNPSIEICCPLLSKLIPQMLDNAFKISLDPIFPPPNFYNPKKIICDNYLDNKFELVFDEVTDAPLLNQSQQNYDIGLIEEESEEEEEPQ
ncbi:unnamed protein product [Paramecium pentaurelia]|uniref:Tubulin-tyrosine ligase family protein n=1 Tax=Paramecium pentaurelia TaxID=43138 RepID=A0A8S1SLE7_9CILI|nr:unnamed protein product [Paramecium pentaurelia]